MTGKIMIECKNIWKYQENMLELFHFYLVLHTSYQSYDGGKSVWNDTLNM